MNASRKNPPDYWGIALRIFSLLPKSPSRNKCVCSLFMGLLFVLATQAHAASTIAGSKLWCGTAIPTGLSDCTYSSDTAAAQTTVDYLTWYCTVGYVNYCGAPYTYFLTGCDGNGRCSYYAKYGSTVYPLSDFQLRSLTTCPANSTPNGTGCTCNTNYVADSAGTSCIFPSQCIAPNVIDPKTGQCGPPPCTAVLPLTPLPADDACAQALDNLQTTQAQKDAACGTLSPALKDGEACLADKLKVINIPGTATPIPLKITSDIRDIAYQAHFREIWDKMEKLVKLEDDPVQSVACATRRAEIAAEKGCDNAGPCESESCYSPSATHRSHCLAGMPAKPKPNDAQHTQGNAFDASRTRTINPLQAVLGARNPPQTIQQFLDGPKPKDCKLIWGGTFSTNYDPVHFYAR